ncbi:MAG: BamA/TamA family outer membrane protein [Cyclobacteriaceae bacterium]
MGLFIKCDKSFAGTIISRPLTVDGRLIGVVILFLISFLIPQAVLAQTPQKIHSIFLIGDAGEPKYAPENLKVLKKQLHEARENSTLIFLGDNIYPKGLGDDEDPERAEQEKKLIDQLEIAKGFGGNTYVIPGNHDWAKGKREGWQHVLNQQKYVREYLEDNNAFQPNDGCPGPTEFELSEGLWLIIFDFQWLLHKFDKPQEESSCEFKNPVEVLQAIDDMLEKHKDERVILASHHPLYSYGLHGGRYPLKDHIFPLAEAVDGLYIPLPGLGSIYPLYRSTIGNIQDIPHPKYKAIRNTIEGYLKEHKNAVYVAGHEHSLQHITKDRVNYIVSGSGSKTTHVVKGRHSQFSASKTGFSRVDYYADGSMTSEFWVADAENPEGKKVHSSRLFEENKKEKEIKPEEAKSIAPTVKVKASSQYDANGIKKAFFGANYRDVWGKEIEVEVFDIGKEHGGLTPVKMGGGMQTKSLRMEAQDGRQYVLRSIEKYAEGAIPPLLRQTIAASIVQDQISASHPYGAFVVPDLAEAAGIYHTNPKIVFVPDDPRFGEFRDKLANTLALYEERPAKNWKDSGQFGDSKDLVNTLEVLEEIQDDNDNFVDQKWALKSRVFDLVIADWDRHDDQWRWASFKEGEGKMYRPIPRDRDQAFFVNQGLIPKITSRRWAIPKVEGFNDNIRWAPGLAFNAKNFDRSFLTKLSRKDWEEAVLALQKNLTDEVIDKAMQRWPQEIYDLSAEKVASTLKSRRDNLMKPALELYEYLAKAVNVLGSNKDELFKVESPADGILKVTVAKISKKGNVQQDIFERTFLAAETKEVRLYGLKGEDKFEISGEARSRIKVRIISGKDKDEIVETSPKQSTKVLVYDKPKTKIESQTSSIKPRLSNNKDIHTYDRMSHKYDVLFPVAYWQYNKDDGLFLGGGFILTKHGWRKTPFAAKHKFSADYAFATNAFNIKYDATFTDVVGKWDLGLLADVRKPFFVDNYFGMGNNSFFDVDNQDIDFYRVRFENILYRATLAKDLGAHGIFSLGLQHRGISLEERTDNFIGGPTSDVSPTDLFETNRKYAGLYTGLAVDTRDNKQLTTRGLYWNTELELLKGINNLSSNYNNIRSEVSFFYSFKFPARVTLGWRVGGAHNFHGFTTQEFYNANTLGGRSSLRGFRRTRFYGESSFYNNLDLRIKLFNFRSYLFPAQFGILAFHDIGRVWYDNENSSTWHDSAGGGFYIAPMGQAVISFSMAFTDEENLPVIGLGFFF